MWEKKQPVFGETCKTGSRLGASWRGDGAWVHRKVRFCFPSLFSYLHIGTPPWTNGASLSRSPIYTYMSIFSPSFCLYMFCLYMSRYINRKREKKYISEQLNSKGCGASSLCVCRPSIHTRPFFFPPSVYLSEQLNREWCGSCLSVSPIYIYTSIFFPSLMFIYIHPSIHAYILTYIHTYKHTNV